MVIEPRTLAQIADRAGYCMADIAFLTELEESTVSRIWDNPDWLDRIKGRSLQALIQVLPGIGEYALAYSLAVRRNDLSERLMKHGVKLDHGAFMDVVRQRLVSEQFISSALRAASCVLERDVRTAAAHLARFYGKNQDYALALVFGNVPESQLLVDPTPLVEASIEVVGHLSTRKNSFHALIAQANLMHHIVLATGVPFDDITVSPTERQTAVAFRSSAIGEIMATNDHDIALRYCSEVARVPLLSLVEQWSFPAYSHDIKMNADFNIPRSALLRRSANEILRELTEYNEAYVNYLVTTAIPTLLQRDRTFGMQRSELTEVLTQRITHCVEPSTRNTCTRLIKSLYDDYSTQRTDSFDCAW